MILWINRCTEPYENMATEEYLLMTATEPTVMLWRNEPAVIIGKNQNARENINFDYTEALNIKAVRRLTGGGAVFHDLGNINYTFIVPESDAPESFSEFSTPIVKALKGLSINAEASGRNDLLADGKKFSGTARCGYLRKDGSRVVMHHGTLLFSADMSRLAGALVTDPEKMKSKGIKSTSSRVVNLCTLLPEEYKDMDAEAFMKYLETYFANADGVRIKEFSAEARKQIKSLADEKYASENWLFRADNGGFNVKKKKRFDFGTVDIRILCSAGEVGMPSIISNISIEGDFIGDNDISELEKKLVGTFYDRNSVLSVLTDIDVSKYISGADATILTNLFFG